MKKIILLMFMIFSLPCLGQVQGIITIVSSAPSGFCSLPVNFIEVVTGAGSYQCISSTWSPVLGNSLLATANTWTLAQTFSATSTLNAGANIASTQVLSWNLDTTICRSAVGVLEIGSSSGCAASGKLSVASVLPGILYSTAGTALPTCAVSIQGQLAVVSDATTPTYMGAYTGGGGITAAVICSYNGATYSWLTH